MKLKDTIKSPLMLYRAIKKYKDKFSPENYELLLEGYISMISGLAIMIMGSVAMIINIALNLFLNWSNELQTVTSLAITALGIGLFSLGSLILIFTIVFRELIRIEGVLPILKERI